jgi:hypothetical protein
MMQASTLILPSSNILNDCGYEYFLLIRHRNNIVEAALQCNYMLSYHLEDHY